MCTRVASLRAAARGIVCALMRDIWMCLHEQSAAADDGDTVHSFNERSYAERVTVHLLSHGGGKNSSALCSSQSRRQMAVSSACSHIQW